MSVNELPLALNATTLLLQVIDLYFENYTQPDVFKQDDLVYLIMSVKGPMQNLEMITLS